MSVFRSVRDAVLPDRASTQTWMVLTFSLFVGLAVLGVALYALLVLRGEMRTAMEQTLHDQAERIAVQVEQAPSPDRRASIVDHLTELTDLRVAVTTPDTSYAAAGVSMPDSLSLSDRRDAPSEARFSSYRDEQGTLVFVAGLSRPTADLTVQVEQPAPPLYHLVQRSQVVLILGMALAFILAVLGSFVAAYQVTTPLRRIRETAQRVAEGQFAGRVRLNSRAA